MKEYVVGFLFDQNLENVLLIKKNRPKWQKGLINGVGGHKNENESYREAMTREFEEEAGLYVPPKLWFKIIEISSYDENNEPYEVVFYYHTGDLSKCRTMTDENLIICPIKELPPNVVYNLRWIIPLALDENFYKYKIQFI